MQVRIESMSKETFNLIILDKNDNVTFYRNYLITKTKELLLKLKNIKIKRFELRCDDAETRSKCVDIFGKFTRSL